MNFQQHLNQECLDGFSNKDKTRFLNLINDESFKLNINEPTTDPDSDEIFFTKIVATAGDGIFSLNDEVCDFVRDYARAVNIKKYSYGDEFGFKEKEIFETEKEILKLFTDFIDDVKDFWYDKHYLAKENINILKILDNFEYELTVKYEWEYDFWRKERNISNDKLKIYNNDYCPKKLANIDDVIKELTKVLKEYQAAIDNLPNRLEYSSFSLIERGKKLAELAKRAIVHYNKVKFEYIYDNYIKHTSEDESVNESEFDIFLKLFRD